MPTSYTGKMMGSFSGIGAYLLTQGLVNENQLQRAEEYKQQLGGRVEQILVNLGVIQREELVSIYAGYLNLPVFTGIDEQTKLPEELLSKVDVSQISTVGATCSYTFTGKAGEVAAVRLARLNSTRLDPTLTILAPNRASKTDDNNGGGTDSAIAGYALPSAGTYTVTAGAANRTTGSFRLALAKCGALPSSGRSTSASLSSGQIACYQFTGRQGQAIDISMDEGKADSTFDPVLDLYTPDGKRRGTAAASGATSARLTDTLPTSGTYTVIARSNRDQGAGSYTLKRTK